MRFAWLILMTIVCGCMSEEVQSGCDRMVEAGIRDYLDGLNFCATRDDCDVEYFGCPFGCYSLVNRYSDLGKARNGTETYHGLCPACRVKCPNPPDESDLECVDGKCQDMRYAPTTTIASGEPGIVRACTYTMTSRCSKCYCMEVGEVCDIVDWSEVGDLAEYVGKNVTYVGERANLKYNRMCPCQMKLTSIVEREEHDAAVVEV